MKVIKRRFIFLGFSGLMVILSIASIFVFGLKPGIDLTGGTQWQVSFTEAPETSAPDVQVFLSDLTGSDVSVKKTDGNEILIRLPSIDEQTHQQYSFKLIQKFGKMEEMNFSSIGPSIGSELRTKAIWAFVFVLFGISLYIAYAFRKVSRPIRSWKYGTVALITLFHDVIIPTGMLALLGYLSGVEIDTNFIVALLVVMGFSVHDTIVVFDRIRENILITRGKIFDLGEVIDESVHETFTRSVNTSLTLILVLLTMLFLGPSSLFYFILTIMVGTIFGTYSSIFIASPLLYISERIGKK